MNVLNSNYLKEVFKQVCEYYNLNPYKVKSKNRNEDLVIVRALFAKYCKTNKVTYKRIADFFGFHHSSIIHYCKVIDRQFKEEFNKLKVFLDLNLTENAN